MRALLPCGEVVWEEWWREWWFVHGGGGQSSSGLVVVEQLALLGYLLYSAEPMRRASVG